MHMNAVWQTYMCALPKCTENFAPLYYHKQKGFMSPVMHFTHIASGLVKRMFMITATL